MENVQTIISHLSRIADKDLARDWDNCGLQVGDYGARINKVLVTLDITDGVIEEAVSRGVEMVISHHPLIFEGLKSIHSRTETGRMILKAVKNDLVLYSAHTNLDIASGGLNDYLAGLLGLTEVEPLSEVEERSVYKLVVYVPVDYFRSVREELFASGAGHIGKYSHTSFSVPGEGTFKPGEDSDPHIGEQGKLSRVEEKKIETVVTASDLNRVIKKMLKVHPYEEPVFDIYRLENGGDKFGIGRIGYLKEKKQLGDLLEEICDLLGSAQLSYTGSSKKEVEKVALCTGSGGDYVKDAAYAGADVYLTGEAKYHQALEAQENNISLIKAGHYQTEVFVKDLLKEYFDGSRLNIETVKSRLNTNPWKNMN